MILFRGWVIIFALGVAERSRGQGREIDFGRDIRPILSNQCFYCHGPDEEHRKAKLRLDVEADAKRESIVPGRPEDSELYKRLVAHDPDELMPPPDSGKSLKPEEIALVAEWIKQGAPYASHWAFTAPTKAALPTVQKKEWARNPIDAFVLGRLERERLEPAPAASPVALLRRVSFDLTGLPPSAGDVERVAASPSALDECVERYLHAPAYGEKWARQWLDGARYADSNGYEKDSPREAWFYRDWVISALNADMPYDRFITEQIAGDLLPGATQAQRVATGFLRNSMVNEEGGADPEQFRMAAGFDRMDTIGKSVLGLTVQCAQCHTHKFDPLQHKDYFRMFAFLNNSSEGSITVYTDEQEKRRQKVLAAVSAVEAEIKAKHPDWATRLDAWESREQGTVSPRWEALDLIADDSAASGQKYLPQEDKSVLAQGYAPAKTTPLFYASTSQSAITAVRFELMTDPNLPRQGPGRSLEGLMALTEFEVSTHARKVGENQRLEKPIRVVAKIDSARADLSVSTRPIPQKFVTAKEKAEKGKKPEEKPRVEGPSEYAIDGDPSTAWSIDAGPGRRNVPREVVFTFAVPVGHAEGTGLQFRLVQNHGGFNNNDNHAYSIGRLRLSVTSDPVKDVRPLPPLVQAVLRTPGRERTESQRATLFSHWRTTDQQLTVYNQRIETLYREYPAGHSQLVMQELAAPRKTMRLDRGDFLSPREEVTPGVPDFLHALPVAAPQNRLGLAQWLVSRQSPTTARSFVNRVWQSYFGVGLTATVEDLGSQGEPPTNAPLLDWLAVEFMEHGWSMKHLHGLIVRSATYRQASHASPILRGRDPDNRLLARGPRFRHSAEAIRDQALLISGLLTEQTGGPSVYPPAPASLFLPPASYGIKTWTEAKDAQRYRRALYTFQFRSAQYPAQQAFDAPTGEVSCVRRPMSNTPLQALTVLNEPLFLECARAFAMKILAHGGGDDVTRMVYAFRQALSRDPEPQEVALLSRLAGQQRERVGTGKEGVAVPRGPSLADVAAWTSIARVLLNMDELLTKE